MHIKRTGILTKIVVLVLIVFALTQLVRISTRSEEAAEEIDDLSKTEAELNAEIDQMKYWIENKDDEDVLREIARGRGYIEPNEEIYHAG